MIREQLTLLMDDLTAGAADCSKWANIVGALSRKSGNLCAQTEEGQSFRYMDIRAACLSFALEELKEVLSAGNVDEAQRTAQLILGEAWIVLIPS